MITATTPPICARVTTTPYLAAYRRTWIELSKQALYHNIATYKRFIGPQVHLAVVIKGNAYGHGLAEIAQLCQENPDVDWLCITTLSEALHVRALSITKPLLVLCILDDDPIKAIEHDIDLIVYDLQTAHMLNDLGMRLQKKVFIHLKIDTGLSRFGFFAQEALATIAALKRLPFISIRGICSHFAESDNADQTFTQQQLHVFSTLLKQLKEHGIDIPFRHINNTAASTSISPLQGNFARIGAGLYGLQPSAFTVTKAQEQDHTFQLKPVMSWKTIIMNIRTIPENTPVGYGKTYITSKPTTIAIIPIGYFEGYDRRLSNKGTVRIVTREGAAHYAPVIGRVCMNVTILDITHIPTAQCGDEVIVLGDYPHISAHEIAHTMQSFNPREITTRINSFIARTVTQ